MRTPLLCTCASHYFAHARPIALHMRAPLYRARPQFANMPPGSPLLPPFLATLRNNQVPNNVPQEFGPKRLVLMVEGSWHSRNQPFLSEAEDSSGSEGGIYFLSGCKFASAIISVF